MAATNELSTGGRNGSAAPPSSGIDPPRWAQTWQRLMDWRIGAIPVPIAVVLAGVLWYFVSHGAVATDLPMMIGLTMLLAFICAEIGHRIPGLRTVGGAVIVATFLPSALAYYHVLPTDLVGAVTRFTKDSNYLFLYIAAIIVGSVFGMDRTVLIKGFVKIFAPLAAGTVAAVIVGALVGTVLGLGMKHAVFYVVLPVMAGGVGDGAVPLSLGYAGALHQGFGGQFAQVLPPVMIGSFFSVLIAGALNWLGKRKPQWSGEGKLQPGEQMDELLRKGEPPQQVDAMTIAAGAVTAVALYLVGELTFVLWKWPAPVVMLALAVAMKLGWSVTRRLELGADVVFQLFAKVGTYPLLFMVGVAMTPWDKLIAALAPADLITIAATVVTLIAVGFWVGRKVNLYPIEAAIVNATHAGQGGTGGVAILTAAERMQLMPFAQIAIRIGGAIVVTLTLLAFARMY
ncbi:MAG TPA: 2-hydroxycarboxylate transporter family protein [Steroidobacteraceae bacterium]|nr:2-hydroxycarboxylate transporter family protein [Steroidobacteraceae bacterium]